MTIQPEPPGRRRSTLLGGAAILLWSTTIAFSRSLTEQLGTLTAAVLIYTTAGLLGLVASALRRGGLSSFWGLPRNYLFICGGLFVTYIACLYLAVGLAATREQVLVVGLINYLWPALSLVFSIPLLGRRARPLLPLGILLALGGTWLSMTGGSTVPFQFLNQEIGSLLPYGLALLASLCWAFYTNLSRRWAADNDGGGVPLFLLASGVVLSLFRCFSMETPNWSLRSGLELLYMAVFPAMLAYILWDIAVRKGEIVLVASLSYLTPLLSTIFSALVLNVKPGAGLWLGAGLVIAGAVTCNRSIISSSSIQPKSARWG